MTLTLDYRWEHALIAATVEAAKRRCPVCSIGRTAIQKLLYFMNVLGVPMKYSFEIHHYGPFCADIMYDVEWLLEDQVIEDQSHEQGRYSSYVPGAHWSDLSEAFKDQLESHQQLIFSVCDALSDLSPETLELIATLDFCYRWVRARGGCDSRRDAAIEKFKQIKKDKFTDAQIHHWYDVLVKAQLVEA